MHGEPATGVQNEKLAFGAVNPVKQNTQFVWKHRGQTPGFQAVGLVETVGIGQHQETLDPSSKLPDAGPDPFGSGIIHNLLYNVYRLHRNQAS
jgi:hypothetical protein